MRCLKIHCGDPAETSSSSFTCFILPFAYKPELITPLHPPEKCYLPFEIPNLDWREKYLTEETANVLFNQAKWFELEEGGYNHLKTFRIKQGKDDEGKDRTCEVRCRPPRLVLFEWPDENRITEKSDNGKTDYDLLQTGMLIVELYFGECRDVFFEDLLWLNELFRYWQKPYQEHDHGPPEKYMDFFKDAGFIKFEDHYLTRWTKLLEPLVKLGDKYISLIPDLSDNDWRVHADSRAYVWTAAVLEKGGNSLRDFFNMPGAPACRFGHWIKLLNVDQPEESELSTHGSTQFERTWADKHTYKRWEEYGTFYGYNYHCGAMLAPQKKANGLPLCRHFREIYLDQALLLLYLRVTLFRFSMKLHEISVGARKDNGHDKTEEWSDRFKKLRWDFSLFTNLYQYPLLSNHQQSLEMYSIARSAMDVDDLFREVQQEIHGCEEHLANRQMDKMTKLTARLTAVAAFAGVFALVHGFPPFMESANKFNFAEFAWLSVVMYIVLAVLFFRGICMVVYYSDELTKYFQRFADKKICGGCSDNDRNK